MVTQKTTQKKEIISQNPNLKREIFKKLNNFLQKKNFLYIPFQPYSIPKTKEEHEKNLEDLINRSDLFSEFIDIRNIKGTRCIKIENEKKINKHLILVLIQNDIFFLRFY